MPRHAPRARVRARHPRRRPAPTAGTAVPPLPTGRSPAIDPLTVVLLLVGFVLLVVGAEWLVRGASAIAAAAGVGPVVIGLTIVAYGTSAPELAVSVGGVLTGANDIAVGNVVGSNAFNLLVVLGLAALAGGLVVHERIVRIDVPLLLAATLVTWWMASDGVIGRLEGGLLFASALAYTAWLVIAARREPRDRTAGFAATAPDRLEARMRPIRAVLLLVVGLGVLVLGADLLVDSAVSLAAAFGVSDLVIGLTIVAVGTSLPELATSVVAARRGERDIAVGNAVGSSLFNLIVVLGGAALVGPSGMPVNADALALDLPVAVVIVLVTVPALALGLRMAPWEGVVLLAVYTAYLVVMVRVGTGAVAVDGLLVPLVAALGGAGVLLLGVGLLLRRRDRVTRR